MNDDIKHSIIKRSLDMFMNKGCRAVTMDEIASANGISKRTLYEVFIDKANLLESCIIHFENDMMQKSRDMRKSAKNALDMIFKIHTCQEDVTLSSVINFFEEIKRLYPIIYNNSIQRFMKFHKAGIIEVIEQGRREGLIIESKDTELISRIILQLTNLIGDTEIFTRTNHARKDLFRSSIIIYVRGLSTEKGRSIIDDYLALHD